MAAQLKEMKNEVLLLQTKSFVQNERRIQVEVLLHLQEIERRKLFLELGFGSLFDFTTKELGYSESAAYRRIQAMRLMKAVPEVKHKISEGSLTLTTAAQMQTFIKAEKKKNVPLSVVQTKVLVETLENKSSRQVERHLLSLVPTAELAQEKVRQVTETHTEIKFIISDELKQKLDQLKLLLSHVKPDMTYQELFECLADKTIRQLKPRTVHQDSPRKISEKLANEMPNKLLCNATPAPKVVGRYISAEIKSAIRSRDGGCCTFTSAITGKKCGSKFQIQYDHIKPFACGGETNFSNLRLLCANHNRWRAEKQFGLVKK